MVAGGLAAAASTMFEWDQRMVGRLRAASLPSASRTLFPLYSTQINNEPPEGISYPSYHYTGYPDVGSHNYLVQMQGASDNDVLGKTPGLPTTLRNAGAKLLLLYQLPYLNYGGSQSWAQAQYFLRDSKNKPIVGSDGAQIFCQADPGFRAAWIRSTVMETNRYGLDGIFWDGPAGFGFFGHSSNGYRLNNAAEWHSTMVQFARELRAALGNKYFACNSLHSYFIGPHQDFAPYIDDFMCESFSSTGYKDSTYDINFHKESMRDLYKMAFTHARNVTMQVDTSFRDTGSAAFTRFMSCCRLMFVGHPYTGPASGAVLHGTTVGSMALGFAASKEDIMNPINANLNVSALGLPLGPPTTNTGTYDMSPTVWTRQFQRATVVADMNNKTGTITFR